MDIVIHLESKNAAKLKEILGKDDKVSRASMVFRDAASIGEKGQLCHISGTEEQCKVALELVKELAKEADPKTREAFLKKLREEEEAAGAGFGSIFG